MSSTEATATPPETDFDHHAPHLSVSHDEVLATYAGLRERCPVVHSSAHDGFYATTGYQAVRTVTGDAEHFSTAEGVILPTQDLPKIVPLEFEGPEHDAWRTIMLAPMTPAKVRELQPVIDEIVRAQIDGFARDGRADLTAALAETVPALVISRMVGLSAEAAPRMRELGSEMVAAVNTDRMPQAAKEFFAFTAAQLEDRRRNPRDDYLTQLASGALGDRPLTDGEVGGILMSFFIGGHHSTTAAISALLHHIITENGVREALANDPGVLPKVIEESLRLSTPLAHFARTVLQDTEIEGCPVPAGSRILLNYVSANRDERRFADPDRFDLARRPNPHVAFGFGGHLCIGRHLARAEMTAVATQLLTRLPDIETDGEVRFSGLIGGNLHRILEFPVRFTPENPNARQNRTADGK
ncbi:cytochrome P450 [Streptomyces sp. NPDC013157]|uniref:cytochrome P450 n=1 Tax=unclassified Streptomyces TaxID=2593676 RepID=UPI0036CDDD5A